MCGTLSCLVKPESSCAIQIAQQTVEDRSGGLQIEPFDIYQATVACCHQNRQPQGTCGLADEDLHVERVTFLDNDIQSCKEFAQGFRSESGCLHLPQAGTGQVRQSFWAELSPCSRRGRDTLARHAIEVGELEAIEVSEARVAAYALCRKCVCDGMTHAQADHTDPELTELTLFLRGDLVLITFQPDCAKCV